MKEYLVIIGVLVVVTVAALLVVNKHDLGGSSPSVEAKVGEEMKGLGVSITPLEVLEDSRCPVDVVCIQVGTVRLRAELVSGLGRAEQEFKLNEPVTTEAEEITLTKVSPAPYSKTQIKEEQYVFTFEIKKR